MYARRRKPHRRTGEEEIIHSRIRKLSQYKTKSWTTGRVNRQIYVRRSMSGNRSLEVTTLSSPYENSREQFCSGKSCDRFTCATYVTARSDETTSGDQSVVLSVHAPCLLRGRSEECENPKSLLPLYKNQNPLFLFPRLVITTLTSHGASFIRSSTECYAIIVVGSRRFRLFCGASQRVPFSFFFFFISFITVYYFATRNRCSASFKSLWSPLRRILYCWPRFGSSPSVVLFLCLASFARRVVCELLYGAY